MVSLLRSTGLVLTNGTLSKRDNNSTWNTAALLDVVNPRHFEVTVQLLGSMQERIPVACLFLLGIAPYHVDVGMLDIETRFGVFVDPILPAAVYEATDERHDIKLPGLGETDVAKTPLSMLFKDGRLYFSFEGYPRLEVCSRIPAGNYRPCVSIGDPQVRLAVQVRRKRGGDGDCAATLKLAKSLWSDKTFADATVVCGSRNLPVHRCVLATASSFFEKAFKGSMRESAEARVRIEDAEPEVVEALIRFLYTGTVEPSVNVMELLPIAHRYGAAGLVDLCGSAIVDELGEDTVVQAVAALRPFRGEEAVRDHWSAVLDRVSNRRDLLERLAAHTR